MLGTAVQLAGTSWLNAPGFHYCGNLLADTVNPADVARLEHLGTTLTQRCQLRGLWGLDYLRTETNELVCLEVNPRYTAAVELYEQASGEPLLHWHRLAGTDETWKAPPAPPRHSTAAKAILYTTAAVWVPWDVNWTQLLSTGCQLSDLPHGGEIIPAGMPLLSLVATSPSIVQAECVLKESVMELQAHIATKQWQEQPHAKHE
jgi:predicted ATP-grasp superfamily ATP-dependent carboligase